VGFQDEVWWGRLAQPTLHAEGVLAGSICTIGAGLLGGAGQSTFSSNVGLSIATKATSRHVALPCGIILILMAFCPKLFAVFAVMPQPVMGAILVYVACFMILAGVQVMTSHILEARKTFVVGIALIFGLSVRMFDEEGRVTIRTQTLLMVTLVLVAAVVATAGVLGWSSRQALLAEAEVQGLVIARLLARSAVFGARVMTAVEAAIGEQMVVQATMAAHLVTLGEAVGVGPQEINRRLEQIADDVEDVHWVDPSTLDFLHLLMAQTSTVRVLVVLTGRPTFAWPADQQTAVTPLALTRLTAAQTAQLITQVAGGKPLPAEVLAQLVARADGVPLYAEELTRMVLESGQLRETATHYELRDRLAPLGYRPTPTPSFYAGQGSKSPRPRRSCAPPITIRHMSSSRPWW
jgi:hypothetical protein